MRRGGTSGILTIFKTGGGKSSYVRVNFVLWLYYCFTTFLYRLYYRCTIILLYRFLDAPMLSGGLLAVEEDVHVAAVGTFKLAVEAEATTVEEAAGANPFDFKFMFLGIRGDDQPTDALSFSAFSASWRASMQSSMSPSMKAGRLCMDQPMRWSVTRDWG